MLFNSSRLCWEIAQYGFIISPKIIKVWKTYEKFGNSSKKTSSKSVWICWYNWKAFLRIIYISQKKKKSSKTLWTCQKYNHIVKRVCIKYWKKLVKFVWNKNLRIPPCKNTNQNKNNNKRPYWMKIFKINQ